MNIDVPLVVISVLTYGVNAQNLSISEYVNAQGYNIEEHANIETEDGYLLTMFRMPPRSRYKVNSTNTPVALLMHGLLGSAENWVIGGPDRALAFQLSEKGYDVWLGNARGNVHSRKHTVYNPDIDREFWQFSFHEIGVYDLATKIEYILEETKTDQIFYVGHSQGTTSFFVLTSERPDFNKYIKLMVALAPVVYLSNLPNPAIQFLSRFDNGIRFLTGLVGINEFKPNNVLLNLAGQILCEEKAVTKDICANVLFLIVGFDSQQLDPEIVPRIAATIPAGGSIQQFAHFAQLINSGQFKKYDYGFFNNFDRYGIETPPLYNIQNITAPVALFYGENDLLISVDDVDRLYGQLPNPVYKYLVSFKYFNHMDFLVAKDVNELVYSYVYLLMDEFLK